MKKITKKAKVAFVRQMLEANANWAKRALIRIYDNQTDNEKVNGNTVEYNGVGFTGCDAEILSSFAEQLKNRGFLSPKQMTILHKKIVIKQ